MKQIDIDCQNVADFYSQVKAAEPKIDLIFRGANGFVALENGVEKPVTPLLNSLRQYNEFFHLGIPFKGTVNVPEPEDFGIKTEEVPIEPPKESLTPIDATPNQEIVGRSDGPEANPPII